MSFLTRNLKQPISIWSHSGHDAYGTPSYSLTTSLGRWEDTQIKAVDFNGNEFISSAIVYLSVDVTPGDYIYLGTSISSSPEVEAREVRSFVKTPSISAIESERRAILK